MFSSKKLEKEFIDRALEQIQNIVSGWFETKSKEP
jgi:hypothetical protein